MNGYEGEEGVCSIAGAGGFIGGHLVKTLIKNGVEVVRAVDIKPLEDWYQVTILSATMAVENLPRPEGKAQLPGLPRGRVACVSARRGHGRHGFIENNAVPDIAALTNTHMLMAAKAHRVKRAFSTRQPAFTTETSRLSLDVISAKRADAYPAMPEDGYGWEKLFSERMCRHFEEGS